MRTKPVRCSPVKDVPLLRALILLCDRADEPDSRGIKAAIEQRDAANKQNSRDFSRDLPSEGSKEQNLEIGRLIK